VTARTPSDDSYVLVVHYYQPHVVGFDMDVSVTSLSHSYAGQFWLCFCLSCLYRVVPGEGEEE